MKEIAIQIQHGGDGWGEITAGGCVTVLLPNFIEQAPLYNIKRFLKLAAQNANKYENAEQIVRLEAYLTGAIREAEKELEVAKIGEDRAEEKRAEKWVTRLVKVREGLTAALEKYKGGKH